VGHYLKYFIPKYVDESMGMLNKLRWLECKATKKLVYVVLTKAKNRSLGTYFVLNRLYQWQEIKKCVKILDLP
jgi:hypothetical protein